MFSDDPKKATVIAHLEDLVETYRNSSATLSSWEEDFIVGLWEKFEKYKDRLLLSDNQADKIEELWEKHVS